MTKSFIEEVKLLQPEQKMAFDEESGCFRTEDGVFASVGCGYCGGDVTTYKFLALAPDMAEKLIAIDNIVKSENCMLAHKEYIAGYNWALERIRKILQGEQE